MEHEPTRFSFNALGRPPPDLFLPLKLVWSPLKPAHLQALDLSRQGMLPWSLDRLGAGRIGELILCQPMPLASD